MMTNNYLKQLNGSYEQYTKLFEQSDGKKLHRASDDAVGYSKYLRYKNSLTNVEQFQEDITTAVSWMKNSDASLVNVTERMKEFKGKVVAAGNSTNNENDMKDIAKELLASVQEVVADMNAQIGDRYLFSGQSDTTMPFEISRDKQKRGETKTLSEAQAKFFTNVGETGSVSQMLKLVDVNNDNNVYYMNVKDGRIYTKDFVENGFKDIDTSDPNYLDPAKLAGKQVGDLGGAFPVSDNFKENGVIIQGTANVGDNWRGNVTVEGQNVEVKFATTEQYIVTYKGDAKYISMVKKTGGIDKATDTVNQTGQDVFGSDIFDYGNSPATGTAMLNDLLYTVAKIDSADYHWTANDGLTISDTAHATVLGAQTTMAARQQAYSAASDMLTTQDESITSDITDVSSTDVAKLATMLMEYQTIYSLSLSVGSKILPGTLADYLH
ncbi:Flagellar hook-associated protein FlgL [Anaerovibrio sp. JC8]|nr:Flagellar hook-associated protein FlgL [Anaerovibrio sp. JC8]